MIIGIDLGTTHSLAAYFADGMPKLIPNALGGVLTPSCVSVDEDGTILLGQAAKERLVSHPERSVGAFKRFMGSQKSWRIGAHTFTPESLSALVLKSLKADAEAYLQQTVEEAVITVPAYFNEPQRRATYAAAQMAGLTVRRLLNEPTAAAMAYGLHENGSERQFLVLDLGGGTFDVTLLELFEGVMEVRAGSGDNALGGEDFTAVLMDFIRQSIPEAAASGLLYRAAEAAKRRLGGAEAAEIVLPSAEGERRITVTAAQYAELCAGLLQRLRRPIEQALRDGKVSLRALDEVILVGGATRMPLIRQYLNRLLGRFPSTALHPDETIALGAAVQAGLLARDQALEEVVMTDVAPYSLGVENVMVLSDGTMRHGLFTPIIERNTVIPVSRVHSFSPVHPEQAEVQFNIYQGEAPYARDNVFLGELTVPLLPKNSRPPQYQDARELSLAVRFTYDASGLLEVDVDILGRRHNLTVENGGKQLDETEIARIRHELEALKIHPRERQEVRALLARGERLYRQHLGRLRAELQYALSVFEQQLDTQDDKIIRNAMTELQRILDGVERDDIW